MLKTEWKAGMTLGTKRKLPRKKPVTRTMKIAAMYQRAAKAAAKGVGYDLMHDKVTWQDMRGTFHKRYAVRSMGPDQGFMVVDACKNTVIIVGFETRQEAREWMQRTAV